MHGLIKAGLLLAPALAGAAATPQENNPSAFITLDLPEVALEHGHPFLSLRLDVLESQSACGSANVTINGEALPKNGKLALPLVPDFDGLNARHATSKKNTPSAVVSWESDCVSWGGMEREQIMRLRVLSINGIDSKSAKQKKAKTADAEDDVTTIRFSQTTPARIIMAEGAASSFLFNDNYYSTEPETEADNTNDDGDDDFVEMTEDDLEDADSADFVAWENSLVLLHHHAALLQHDIRMREHYIADRFDSPAAQHAFGDHHHNGHVTAMIGSFIHKVTGTARAIYGEWVATTFGDDGLRGPPGGFHGPPGGPPGPHPHGGPHGPHGGPRGPHGGPDAFGPHHGPLGHHSPWSAPICFPGSGRDHSGPPPPPAAPPSFLFHCPSGPAPPREQGPPHRPHDHQGPPHHPHDDQGSPEPHAPEHQDHQGPPHRPHHDHEGPAEVHAHDHQGPPQGPPGPPGPPPHDGPFGHPHPDNAPDHPPHNEPHHEPPHDGPMEHGPDGPGGPPEMAFPPPPGPPPGEGPHHRHAPIKVAALFSLVLVLFLVFVRQCSNRRMQARRARRFSDANGSVSGDSFEYHEHRLTRRARRSSGRGLFSSLRRFLSADDDFYEKVADDESDIEGVPECAEISRPATPVVAMEEEDAEPDAEDVEEEEEDAVDVEEEEETEEEQPAAAAPVENSKEQQELAPFRQAPTAATPSPSMASASSVYSGYGRRDPVGIATDFDETESMPPAYSSADYAYVNVIEASVVADGFQYRPSSF